MEVDDAAALIAPAVRRPGGVWADLGAGRGTFTRALAGLLRSAGRVAAVDRDPAAVAALARLPRRADAAAVTPCAADFADARALDALGLPPLDGALLANALHFVPAAAQGAVLADLLGRLVPGGRLVVVEYEDRRPSRWVPAPVPLARLTALAGALASADAAGAVPVGSRPSAFGGTMYAAFVERRGVRHLHGEAPCPSYRGQDAPRLRV